MTPYTALVIEDNKMNLELITDVLELDERSRPKATAGSGRSATETSTPARCSSHGRYGSKVTNSRGDDFQFQLNRSNYGNSSLTTGTFLVTC